MDSNSYRFRVGDFECIAVSDGFHTYAPPDFPPPATLLFANAPAESLESVGNKYTLPSPWTEWVSPYICLVIRTDRHLVLVDTGAGDLAPTTGKLIKNLRIESITPQDIDIVINTHGHPDHLGGNLDASGKPAFPKARYVISRDEWEFWTSSQAEQKLMGHSKEVLLNIARKNLQPLKSRLQLVDGETDIVSGIKVLTTPGHTPGHIALSISSNNEQLICLSDTVLHPVHLEQVSWNCVFDIVPDFVPGSRRKILGMAAAEKARVIAFHFPFPGLGHVIPEGDAWRWQPVNKDN